MLYGAKLAAFFVFGLLFFSWVQTSLTPSFKYRATKGWGLTNTWNFLKAFYRPQSYSCNTVLSNIMWYNVWFCPFCVHYSTCAGALADSRAADLHKHCRPREICPPSTVYCPAYPVFFFQLQNTTLWAICLTWPAARKKRRKKSVPSDFKKPAIAVMEAMMMTCQRKANTAQTLQSQLSTNRSLDSLHKLYPRVLSLIQVNKR